ncbi:tRNA selenocysteine 1-associated protein 1 [Danio rerio]|uniref:tRNA selenocysteine 1-associated protein 1 n=2 Tax=Danio rerio TaxID=7955 RepID=TSAP1_DANRE|nr:tRNA selenocysteine 1-associated protein 1 [Danio rerio]Q503H1.1 RecName: Full=tRNA selenocysteine 1-associated protein 1; AltName: Full=tRNA selenocysteine-associated protein 1 [Danio rerio]AAH95331.1 Zgc:110606 [Danio rerio]AAI64339.1 Zgc:110606 protein [Danio rerio]|eukprot:NP_001018445.1 tRNA selenocysteine 1-associated protein 1 [Danio rerio]
MNSLWMGNLEPYMDEDFICRAFAQMGETVVKIRLIRDKITGKNAGYGFVELADDTAVERCLRKVNGKPLPGATPPKRFKLSRSNYGKQGESSTFSLFVSDLTPDVDDGMLYEFFHYHFSSCCSGKIVLDANGHSKCCGFVSFESEREQKRALVDLQGATGLGKKALRLSLASSRVNKKKESSENQIWQYHSDSKNASFINQYYYPQNLSYLSTYDWNYSLDYLNPSQNTTPVDVTQSEQTEDDDLEYPDSEINVTEANETFMAQSEELYSALIGCFFQPPESWDGVTCSASSYLPEPINQYEMEDSCSSNWVTT